MKSGWSMKRNNWVDWVHASTGALAYFTSTGLFAVLHLPVAGRIPWVLLYVFCTFGALSVYQGLLRLLPPRNGPA